MACITISQATKRGFASRPTLYRAIKDGRLTAVLEGDKMTLICFKSRIPIMKRLSVPGRPATEKQPATRSSIQSQSISSAP